MNKYVCVCMCGGIYTKQKDRSDFPDELTGNIPGLSPTRPWSHTIFKQRTDDPSIWKSNKEERCESNK